MKKFIVGFAVMACLLVAGGLQAASQDGAAIYKERCASCHGQDGQTSKGNAKSGIRMYSSAEVQQKLKGYVSGGYGGSGKSVMQNVAKNLAPDQTQAVSDYVGNMKKQ